jgi:hypothetical protein
MSGLKEMSILFTFSSIVVKMAFAPLLDSLLLLNLISVMSAVFGKFLRSLVANSSPRLRLSNFKTPLASLFGQYRVGFM